MIVEIVVAVLGLGTVLARRSLAAYNLSLRRALLRQSELDEDDARLAEPMFALLGVGIAAVALYLLVKP